MSIIPFDDRDGFIWLNGEMMPWREDPGIHQILSRILPEEEIKASFQLETEALIQIRQNLEARFLQRIQQENDNKLLEHADD